MKLTSTFLSFAIGMALCLFSLKSNAQNENALAFDNIDDNVSVANASSLIANSTQMAMTLWVYPQNSTMTGLDYDGFCGFRDNALADFYIVQLNATGKVECRFRNSSGTAYDITYLNVNVNAWNHLAFTYDGSYLRLYHNTVLKDSIAASGTISSQTASFSLGKLFWPGSDFYLKGKLDEVSLWNRTLSQSEINCIYLNGIDSTDANLQLYYRFNQGTAGGNNAGLTSLHDAAGNINGVLNGFSLSGTTSNYVAGKTNYVNIVDSICSGSTYLFNGQNLATSGVYTQTFTAVNGCDSLVQLTLTVNTIDTSVSQSGVVLAANQNGATYKWVDCNNNYAPIPGGILKTFSPSQPGSYAVIVTKSGCSDTSNCRTVTSAGLFEHNSNSTIVVYPATASDHVTIETADIKKTVQISITDISGRTVFSNNYFDFQKEIIDVSYFAKGSYLLQAKTESFIETLRFIKN